MQEFLLVIGAYFLGDIPFSYLFSRLFGGGDIRKKGSGNVGATNVLRTMGIGVAMAALAGDVGKGMLAAWLGLHFGGSAVAAGCAVAAVIGHCWPAFLGFRGGKGVATSAGVLLVLTPKIVLILLACFVIIIAVSRYVSLGSVSVAAALPVLNLLFVDSLPYIIMSIVLAVLVIYRHRENISRLRNGTESKISKA